MSLLDGLKKESLITNTKGAKYYKSTWDHNLDLFCAISRYDDEMKITSFFDSAFKEDRILALANLLYFLDIRGGKGERRIFKIIFKYLCLNYPDEARMMLSFIPNLGRYDYILVGIGTKIEDDVIELIKKQLKIDELEEHPSLLAKWLPSLRTHDKNKKDAKILVKKLGMSEKDYRKLLKRLRDKINIVETNLSFKNYEKIDFECVPAKAMIKYNKAFTKYKKEELENYLENVKVGNKKINTTGLYCYEIIRNILFNKNCNDDLLDTMWNNQVDILKGNDSNVLVVADTSGSMFSYNAIPFATSLGLAIYIAKRNKGIFKNHFITFSSKPQIQELRGRTLREILSNIEAIIDKTDIDAVFNLLLNTAIKSNLKQNDLPSHIIIISDMEFDEGVMTKNGTNFSGWKEEFANNGYKLPIIIFWNVAGCTNGVPVTKYDGDVAIISGFSTNVLENILDLEKYNLMDVMKEKLEKYINMLKESE